MRRLTLSIVTVVHILMGWTLLAQDVDILSISDAAFPVMRAEVMFYDASDRPVSPPAGDVTLMRNGRPTPIRSMTCPERVVRPFSTVLSMDISGSMAGTNISIAQAVAKEWIAAMDADGSECAIMSFNRVNAFVHDFSTDRTVLSAAIDALSPGGGTNYDAALIDSVFGALRMSRGASQKRIIIVITDGVGLLERSTEIIQEARSQNATIYAVMIKGDIAPQLDSVARATGGMSISNVNSVAEARKAFATIRYFAERNGACELTWDEEALCATVDPQVAVRVGYQSGGEQRIYRPRPENIIALTVTPPFLAFGKRTPNVAHDTTVTFSASVRDITILAVSNPSAQPTFTILDPLPITVRVGQPRTVRVRCFPRDSSRVYERLTLVLDSCTARFSATCGSFGRGVSNSSLRIVHPNGGERFIVGEDTVVTWSGTAESDTVRLEISRDGGATWMDLARATTDGVHRWRPVTGPPAPSCLIRATQYETGSGQVEPRRDARIDAIDSRFRDCAWLEVDATIIGVGDSTAGLNGLVARYSLDGPTTIGRTMLGTNPISSVDLRRDGGIVTGGAEGDGYVSLFDPQTLALVRRITRHFAGVSSVAVAPSDTLVASGCFDGTIRITSIASGTIRHTIGDRNVSPAVTTLGWTPDGTVLAFGDVQGGVTVWDALGARVVRRMDIHAPGSRVTEIDIHPNGVALASVGRDSIIAVTNVLTGKPMRVSRRFPNTLNSVAWSPDGSLIAVVESETFVHILDASTLFTLATIPTPTLYALRVRWSPSGELIAIAGAAGIEVWGLRAEPIQQDVSDAPFAIVEPWPVGRDVDMRRVVTGSFRDSVITNAVRNAGAYPFRVDTVIVQGPDAAAFSRVSGGVRSVVAPGADHAIEMRFRPLRVGTHRADLLIVTSSDTLVHTIRGEGVLEAASVAPTVIDMGTVRIGARKDSARAIIVRNRSTGAVRVRSITPLGADLTSFTVTGTVPRVIPAGGVAEYDVAFAPFTTNRTACTFQIDVDVDGGPFSVQVVGKGTQEGAAITVIPPRTVLRCEADTIDTVRIGNTGTRDLVVRSAVFSGAHAVDYAMLTPFPQTIVPGDTLAAAFLVAPTDAGVRVASLTIEHSEGAPIVVPIDARKDSGAAQFVERVIDIGTVCSGVTIDTSVVIANPGTVDVTATLAGQGVVVTPTVSVPAGDSIRIPVRLTMSASTGAVDIVLTATEVECGHVSIMRFIGRADTSVVRVPAEIDLGTVCGDADVLSTLIITNRASASVQATLRASASITIDTSTMLAPRSATVVSFTWIGRGRAGTIADTIIVRDDACGVDHPVIIRADVISAAIAADPIVDVGPHLVGTIVRDTLLIVNIGPVPVRVPAPQGIAGPLTLVDLVPPAGTMLMPNDTARAVIDVLVTLGDGERTVTWPIVEPCSQNLEQRVRWTGGTADTVRTAVWIDDVTGAAGERGTLRLRMSAEAADPSRLPTAYQAEIRVNPTCVISTDPSITCVSDTPDGCTYTIVGSRSASDTLITIPVLITLGTTDRSPLEVQSFTWTDPRATTIVTTTNGTLTVEGICEEGGVRLFVPTGVSLSCVVRPNPASDVATVEYGCVESGLVTMEIIDAQGRVVLTPLASIAVTTGVYVRSVDVATLPNGVYFVRLSTPSDVLVTRFDIVR